METPEGMSWGIDWALLPSTLPPREMTYQRILKLRAFSWYECTASAFPEQKAPLTIPANTLILLLLDQTFETNAYVTLNFSGSKGCRNFVRLRRSTLRKGQQRQAQR